jgi:uncharacterized protein (TIGR03086 family)
MEAKALFSSSLQPAASCIKRITLEELGNATPCRDWDLRKLLNHMVYELCWIPDVLAGKTLEEVGDVYDGDLLDDNPKSAWQRAAKAAAMAVEMADIYRIVHLSYADVSAEHYINEVGSDMLIHGWDVGQSLFCSMIFEPKLTQAAFDFVLPRAEEFRASGLFGEELPTNPDDSMQTKLLAFYGRKEGSLLAG